MDTLGIILSSALIAALFSSAVTIYISKLSYKQKYFEKIIEKRLQAHEEINSFISQLKTSIQDSTSTDRRTYHAVFSGGFESFIIETHGALKDTARFWVSDATSEAILNLNKEFFRCGLLYDELGQDLVEVGRREYTEVARLRDELEQALLFELLNLHDIKKFLKNKSVKTVFTRYDLKQRVG